MLLEKSRRKRIVDDEPDYKEATKKDRE